MAFEFLYVCFSLSLILCHPVRFMHITHNLIKKPTHVLSIITAKGSARRPRRLSPPSEPRRTRSDGRRFLRTRCEQTRARTS